MPRCPNHGKERAEMDPALLLVRFPEGSLPARGFRCPRCLDEWLPGAESKRLEDLARTLGLFGPEDARHRRLVRAGNSLAVTIDPEFARRVLGSDRPGARVRVSRMGQRIIIEPDPAAA